jgi:hypothetical protein
VKATIENIINGTNLEDFELNFDWILLKRNRHDWSCTYELCFNETTFYPNYIKSIHQRLNEEKDYDASKDLIQSPIWKKFVEIRRNTAEMWFKNHEIYSGKDLSFCDDSPEAIKNDICFSKILPYVDPTKMEVIDLTK